MWKRLLDLVERWDMAWTIIAFNLVGFVTGIVFWYGDHLLGTADRWYLWPFIPDCPLFAGLFIIAFLGLRRGRNWRLFYTITGYGLIKYGVWTVLYWIVYWLRGGPVEPLGLAMCFSHLGMIGEGLYVSYRILSPVSRAAAQGTPPPRRGRLGGSGLPRPTPIPPSPGPSLRGRGVSHPGFRLRDVLIGFGWFLLNDYVDYGLGQYPMFDTQVVSMALMKWHTIFMTFALAAVYFALSRRRGLVDW